MAYQGPIGTSMAKSGGVISLIINNPLKKSHIVATVKCSLQLPNSHMYYNIYKLSLFDIRVLKIKYQLPSFCILRIVL